ncbi:helix-turn-helix transcriptional regulator [Roseomonas sp. 18066]|uniref:helix-turn-helix domain-containing protein n=1 Tax=Roseomonas sp. 18066 TaxID=2681412 RepID=UPI001357C1F5|nr:helix-turn-helix transcriptional regulator [Roseomonas sp. 18066]
MDIPLSPLVARIDSRLDRLDLTAEEAFRHAGLAPDLLEKMRAGKAPMPRGPKLARLAEALGTSVAYLVGLDPDAEPPAELLQDDQATLGLLAGDEEALLRAYRRLDPAAKAALQLVVQKMAGPG